MYEFNYEDIYEGTMEYEALDELFRELRIAPSHKDIAFDVDSGVLAYTLIARTTGAEVRSMSVLQPHMVRDFLERFNSVD